MTNRKRIERIEATRQNGRFRVIVLKDGEEPSKDDGFKSFTVFVACDVAAVG